MSWKKKKQKEILDDIAKERKYENVRILFGFLLISLAAYGLQYSCSLPYYEKWKVIETEYAEVETEPKPLYDDRRDKFFFGPRRDDHIWSVMVRKRSGLEEAITCGYETVGQKVKIHALRSSITGRRQQVSLCEECSWTRKIINQNGPPEAATRSNRPLFPGNL